MTQEPKSHRLDVASEFTMQDARRAASMLERLLDTAWVLCGVRDTPIENNARQTLRVLTANAISLLARPTPTSITWGSLLKAYDSGASASKHAAEQVLKAKFLRVMRCVIALAVAERDRDLDFSYLFAHPTSSGESTRRLGVTRGQDAAVIGVALVDHMEAPIAVFRELLESSRDSPSHREYDQERARLFANEISRDSLPSSLSQEVIALMEDERAAREVAFGLASDPDIPTDHGVNLLRLAQNGFPSMLVATELRVPLEGKHGVQPRFLGADNELVSALLGGGLDVVLQATELKGVDAATPPVDLAAWIAGMDAPEIVQLTLADLRRINQTISVLAMTGRAIVPGSTRYWTAKQTVNGQRVYLIGRHHEGSYSHQVFRVGSSNDASGFFRDRAVGLIEVVVRHHALFGRPRGDKRGEVRGMLRAQIDAIQPLKLGGQRLSVQRTAMTIMNTAYVLLLAARRERPENR